QWSASSSSPARQPTTRARLPSIARRYIPTSPSIAIQNRQSKIQNSLSRSARKQAAIGEDDFAREEAGFLAREEERGVRDIKRRPQPAQRRPCDQLLQAPLVGAHARRHWRLNETRADGVDADLLRRHF